MDLNGCGYLANICMNCGLIQNLSEIRCGIKIYRVQCILSYDGLRQRRSITFSKGSVRILERDLNIH